MNEVYETVLAPYILLPTTVALIAPKHGKFNVTAKGGLQDESYFDRRIATPYLFLIALNVTGICLAVPRYLYWDPGHAGTIAVNVFWTIFNLVILGTALAVCYEQRQRRESTRIVCSIPVRLHTESGIVNGIATNISNGGLAVKTTGQWKPGARTRVEFTDQEEPVFLEADVCSHKAKQVRFRFTGSTLEDERKLTRVLYATPNRWSGWYAEESKDRPFLSMARIFRLSLLGFWRVLHAPGRPAAKDEDDKEEIETSVRSRRRRDSVTAAAVLLTLCLPVPSSHAAPIILPGAKVAAAPAPAATPHSFSFASASSDSLSLHQPGSRATIQFSVPSTWFVRSGTLHLRYALPGPSQGNDQSSVAEVRLNGATLASVLPSQQELANGAGELDVPLPAEMIVRKNVLTIQLAGDSNAACTRKTQPSTPLRIDSSSQVTLEALPLHITNDLHALPNPFLEHLASSPAMIPVVFGRQPSPMTLQAAGIVASWFGMQDDETHMHFPARVGSIPTGNAIVLLTGADALDGVSVANGDPRSVALIDNPVDLYGKLLVLRGHNDGDLLEAAQSFALDQRNLAGSNSLLRSIDLPPERNPDDAPRWIHTERVALSQLMTPVDRKTNGPSPINLYMHLAPDYNFGSHQRMYLHLNYATDAQSIGKASNITARLNGQTIDSYPLHSGRSMRPIDVPLTEIPMATYANTLQLQFYFAGAGSGCGAPTGPTNAEVLGSSFLDMGGAVHHASMPNLKLFAKAGFPFTRIADLSETAVLLPDNPSLEAASFYLDLMSYFGSQTGYPALRVQVGSIAQAEEFSDKDLLVLGSFDDLAASPKLAGKLPASFEDNAISFNLVARLGALTKALRTFDFSNAGTVRDSESHNADGMIAGFESPFASGRSVVAALARQNDQIPTMAASMISAMPADAIDNTVTLWNAEGFHSYPLLTSTYFVGRLPRYETLRYSLPQAAVAACVPFIACHFCDWFMGQPLAELSRPSSSATVQPAQERKPVYCLCPVRSLVQAECCHSNSANSGDGSMKFKAEIALLLALVASSSLGKTAGAQSSPAEVLAQRATSLDGQGHHDLAAETWRQLLSLNPNNPQALAALANYYRSTGDNATATRYINQLRQTNVSKGELNQIESTPSSGDEDAALKEAGRLASQHKYAEALALYRKAFHGTAPSGTWALAYYETEAAVQAKCRRPSRASRTCKTVPCKYRLLAFTGRVLTYRQETRLEGVHILENIKGTVAQMNAARDAWRQAILWDLTGPAATETSQSFLARYNDTELANALPQCACPAARPRRNRRREGTGRRVRGAWQGRSRGG